MKINGSINTNLHSIRGGLKTPLSSINGEIAKNNGTKSMKITGAVKSNLHSIGGDLKTSLSAVNGEITKSNGTRDYNKLINKPQINEVELEGNKSFEELGVNTLTNIEIQSIFNRVFKGGN